MVLRPVNGYRHRKPGPVSGSTQMGNVGLAINEYPLLWEARNGLAKKETKVASATQMQEDIPRSARHSADVRTAGRAVLVEWAWIS